MADLRAGIIRLHEQAQKPREIARLLDVPPRTVYDAIKRFEETGSNKDRPRSGRPAIAVTNENIQLIADKICYCNDHEEGHIHSKSDSTRKLATELGISRESVRKMIEEIFQMKSRKTAEGQQLNDTAKEKRLTLCKRLARRFASYRHRNILFTDEKWFDIEQSRNSQNDRIWSAHPLPPELKFVERTQKPKQVMVWAGVSYDAKTPLIFVPQGVKVDGPAYREMLADEVLPWAEENMDDSWTYQQDGAPLHRALETQEWIEQHFPDSIKVDSDWGANPTINGDWPPNSPDLTVMDYFVWPYLQSKVYSKPHKTIASLKESLVKEWDEIPQEMIQKAIDNFPKRLKKCINANGGHFDE